MAAESRDWNAPNYAEFQARIDSGDVTFAECRRMGSTHYAYGWASNPPVQWNAEQRGAYLLGYTDAMAADKGK